MLSGFAQKEKIVKKVLLALPFALLAACGGQPPAGNTATDSADLKSAVTAYSDAYLSGDATAAYDLLSARCQGRMSVEQFGGLVSAAKAAYGDALPIKAFDAKVSDDLARVTYTYGVPALDQDSEPWVQENGDWREDDC